MLKRLPNVNIVSTHQSTCVTVVGDLHGSLSDLMVIFHKVYTINFYFLEKIIIILLNRMVYHRMKILIYLMEILLIEVFKVWKYLF
jgi:hypothetical protein